MRSRSLVGDVPCLSDVTYGGGSTLLAAEGLPQRCSTWSLGRAHVELNLKLDIAGMRLPMPHPAYILSQMLRLQQDDVPC